MFTLPVVALPVPRDYPDLGCGQLQVEGRPLPLKDVTVEASVLGLYATAKVAQRFVNPLEEPVEVTYVFPLPSRAGVTAFSATLGGRRVEGRVEERGKAREEYDTAIAAGQRAAIAEEERPEVFTVSVGNLLAGEEAVVEFLLTMPLGVEGGTAQFRFPLVVAPRYTSGAPLEGEQTGDGLASDTDLVPDASRVSPARLESWEQRPQLSFKVEVDGGGLSVKNLRSTLHAVSESNPESGPCTLEVTPGEKLDRDFVLRFDLDEAELSSSAVLVPDAEGDEGTFDVTLYEPPLKRRRARDVVVVLDRSGSMGGWKMVAARRAAARIVDSLDVSDRFAVIAFDDRIELVPELGSELKEASDQNRFRAVEFLSKLEARGGTRAEQPLMDAAQLLKDATRDRSVVFVTDGQVTGEGSVLGAFASASLGARVHSVGIDQAVNAGFLTRLSESTGGLLFTVESEDRLDEALVMVRRTLGAPALADVQVTAEGIELISSTLTPSGTADAFDGVPLRLSGRYKKMRKKKVVLHVEGLRGKKPCSFDLVPSVESASAASVVWARSLVRQLEDQYEVAQLGGRWGAPASETVDLEALSKEIVAHSIRFGVLSRFTAFICVDPEETDAEDMKRISQPVESPAGWSSLSYGAVMPQAVNASVLGAMPRSMRSGSVSYAAGSSTDMWSAPPSSAFPEMLAAGPAAFQDSAFQSLPVPSTPEELLQQISSALQVEDSAELLLLLAELDQLLLNWPLSGVSLEDAHRIRSAVSEYLGSQQKRKEALALVQAALQGSSPQRRNFWK